MNIKIDFMIVILSCIIMFIVISFWKAHTKPGFAFNAFDLIMVDGKVDAVAVSYMLVLGVTTWILLDLHIVGKLTEGYYTTYGALWVVPLVAKFVFKKMDAPTMQTSSMTTTVTTSDPVPATPPPPPENGIPNEPLR